METYLPHGKYFIAFEISSNSLFQAQIRLGRRHDRPWRHKRKITICETWASLSHCPFKRANMWASVFDVRSALRRGSWPQHDDSTAKWGGLVKVQNLKKIADVINENLQKKTLSTEFCPSFPSPHSNNPLGRHLLLPSIAVPPEAHVVPRVDLLHTPVDRQGALGPLPKIRMQHVQGTPTKNISQNSKYSKKALSLNE